MCVTHSIKCSLICVTVTLCFCYSQALQNFKIVPRAAHTKHAMPLGTVTPINVAAVKLELVTVAPLRLAPLRLAPLRLAPLRLAPMRVACMKSRFARSKTTHVNIGQVFGEAVYQSGYNHSDWHQRELFV